jgi:hypothetical protein
MSENEDYCVEEEAHKCEGCIFNIVGERKDKRGYVMKTAACLCEQEMCASCAPSYQFSDYKIYEGELTFPKDSFGFVFKRSKPKRLLKNVTKHKFILSDVQK